MDTRCDSMLKNEVKRRLRLRNGKKCDGLVNGCDNTYYATKTYQSLFVLHKDVEIVMKNNAFVRLPVSKAAKTLWDGYLCCRTLGCNVA